MSETQIKATFRSIQALDHALIIYHLLVNTRVLRNLQTTFPGLLCQLAACLVLLMEVSGCKLKGRRKGGVLLSLYLHWYCSNRKGFLAPPTVFLSPLSTSWPHAQKAPPSAGLCLSRDSSLHWQSSPMVVMTPPLHPGSGCGRRLWRQLQWSTHYNLMPFPCLLSNLLLTKII